MPRSVVRIIAALLSAKSDAFAMTRYTPAQAAVLEALRQQSQPISAQALYVQMCERQRIGLATVYRALDALKRLGQVQHRTTLNGETLYNTVEQDRHYLTCLHCGQSFPLTTCPLKGLKLQSQQSGSFSVYYHTLEFFGLCQPCQVEAGTKGEKLEV